MGALLSSFLGKLSENIIFAILTPLVLGGIALVFRAWRLKNPLHLMPKQTEARLSSPNGSPMAQVALVEAVEDEKGCWKSGETLGVTDENGRSTLSIGPKCQAILCIWGESERLQVRNADASVWSTICRVSPAQHEIRLVVQHAGKLPT